MKKKVISALLVFALIISVIVPMSAVHGADSGDCGNGLTWSYDKGSGALTVSGTGAMPDYTGKTVPWYDYRMNIYSINVEEGVTSIGNWAFSYCYYARMINLPETLTSIGDYVFYNCHSIEEVLLPESVTSIGDAAFSYCKKLQSVAIPKNITLITKYNFFDCFALENVYYAGTQEQWNAINIEASNDALVNATIMTDTVAGTSWKFDETTATLTISGYGRMKNYTAKGTPWFDYANDIKKIVVEEGVTGLGNWAFAYCYYVTEVELPESLVHIGSGAFYNCLTLASIDIPEGVTRIFSGAFYNCKKLTAITIPVGVTTIYANTFLSCSALSEVSFNGTAVQWQKVEILKNNTELTSLTMNCLVKSIEWTLSDDGTLTIGGGVAMDDYELKVAPMAPWANVKAQVRKVVILDGIPNIGKNAFYGCTNLTEVVIPDSVTSIGYGAFWSCTSLQSIELPDTVTYMGAAVFYNCSGLKEITVPKSLTTVYAHSFYNCKSLETVNYTGTETEFNAISVNATNNEYFINANVVYVTETETVTGPVFKVIGANAGAGDTVQVAVEVENNPGILGMTLSVSFDESVMTLSSAANGDALTMLTLTKPKDFISGCNFVWDGVEVAQEDIRDGSVLILTFDIADTAKSGSYEVAVSYVENDIIGADLSFIAPDIQNGNIVIA